MSRRLRRGCSERRTAVAELVREDSAELLGGEGEHVSPVRRDSLDAIERFVLFEVDAGRRARLVSIVSSTAREDIVAILRSAYSPERDPRLDDILEAFKSQWRRIASKRYPTLLQDADDAIQNAVLKLLSPGKLATLKDPARIEAWARSLFVRAVLDLARDRQRDRSRRASPAGPGEDPEEFLRDRLPSTGLSPEELAEQSERFQIVSRWIGEFEVAQLRFVRGLPEKEIAELLGLTRDAVAGRLKRFRKGLAAELGGAEGPDG